MNIQKNLDQINHRISKKTELVKKTEEKLTQERENLANLCKEKEALIGKAILGATDEKSLIPIIEDVIKKAEEAGQNLEESDYIKLDEMI